MTSFAWAVENPRRSGRICRRRWKMCSRAARCAWRKPRGTAAGDLTKAPPVPVFTDTKWSIGEPDMVITAATEEKLPATGYIPYRYVIMPHLFLHDTWVQGIEIMPANTKVVHHANLAFTT